MLREAVVLAIGLYWPLDIGKRTLVRAHVRRMLRTNGRANADSRVVRRDGLMFQLAMDEEIDQWIYLTGWWERADCCTALDALEKGDSVIDVGANIGSFALRAAVAVGSAGQVFAFEPNPQCFERLGKNARLNDLEHLVTVPQAVGDRSGSIELLIPHRGAAGGASMFHSWVDTVQRTYKSPGAVSLGGGTGVGERENQTASAVTVSMVSIDQFCQEREVRRISFVKVDVEGAEPGVLLGATETLRRDKPRLMVECNRPALAAGGWTVPDFLGLIRGFGYRTFIRGRWTRRLREVTRAEGITRDLCDLHCIAR